MSPNTIVVDCETYLIQPGNLLPRVVSCQIGYHAYGTLQDVIVHTDRVKMVETILGHLNEATIIVGHNVVFDLGVLCQAAFEETQYGQAFLESVFAALDDGRIRDTKIREQLIAIAQDDFEFDKILNKPHRFSLADCVMRRFSVDISESKKDPSSWRLRYAELDDVPFELWPGDAKAYATDDVVWTSKLFDIQSKPESIDGNVLVSDSGAVTDELPQMKAAWALHLLSAWGIRVDASKAKAFETSVIEQVEKGKAIARQAGFLRDNDTKDMKALKALISHAYAKRGESPPTTDKGAVKTDRDTLEQSGDPALIAFAEVSKYNTLLSTFVPQLKGGTVHPINPNYNVLVRTGRISCEHPNLTNPPRMEGFRENFVPRQGRAFVSADFDLAELKAMGQLQTWWFGASTLADALNAGRDVHVDLAADLLGISYDEALAMKKADDERMTGAQGARQIAKICNFGAMGGLGAPGMVGYARGYDVFLEEIEARTILDKWREKWSPQMDQYFDLISRSTQWRPMVAVQAVSERIRGGCHFTNGCNTFFQGLVADFAKAALYEVSKECYIVEDSPLYGCRPVIFLHDEIIMEAPLEHVHEAAERLVTIMCEAEQAYMPDLLPGAEAKAMLCWSKKAKPVFDTNGRLIPWTKK